MVQRALDNLIILDPTKGLAKHELGKELSRAKLFFPCGGVRSMYFLVSIDQQFSPGGNTPDDDTGLKTRVFVFFSSSVRGFASCGV